MQKLMKIAFISLLLFSFFSSFSIFAQPQDNNQKEVQDSWSSTGDVFTKQDINKLIKKPMAGPIKIGFTAKEVREVMGVPDTMDEEGHVYYYRQSPIFFDKDWQVQSWDNRYGNLDVLPESVRIRPGSHISEVFKLNGFPLRITKIDGSYHLEYPGDIIYVSDNWEVEAIQDKQVVEYKSGRQDMNLEDFLEEFKNYLKLK
jgi:hypothetical protein